MSAARHIAQFNVARLRYSLDDPRSAGFRDNLDRVNAAAKRMPGFVWILEDDAGTATNFRIDDDPQMLINLSVWESLAHLRTFVFGPVHKSFLDKREDWFEPPSAPYLALWFIDEGVRPALEEGAARLAHLRAHGASDYAFGWEDVRASAP
ncbi:MAG: DUF3291 domain-containing protein [Caulobacterales bacterium]